MNANTTISSFPALSGHLLAILLVAGAVIFIRVDKLPSPTTYRIAMIVLVVGGFVACSIGGIGRVSTMQAWAHPISILGYLLGFLILLIAGTSLLGKPFLMINSERVAFMAVTGLIVLKMILTQLHSLIYSA